MRIAWQTFLALIVAGTPLAAQQVDRAGVLHAALRSALRDRLGWGPATVGVVAARTTAACDGLSCPAKDFIPGSTLPLSLHAYARDSLAARVVDRPDAEYQPSCSVGKTPAFVRLAEPTVHGDSAYVGLEWHSCVARPSPRDSVERAILFLHRAGGQWRVGSAKHYPLCNPAPFGNATTPSSRR